MPKWTKESSISELTLLINEVDSLTGVRRHSAPHTRWLARTLKFLEQVFGVASTYYLSLVSIPWSRTGTFIVPGSDLGRGFESRIRKHILISLTVRRGCFRQHSTNCRYLNSPRCTSARTQDLSQAHFG